MQLLKSLFLTAVVASSVHAQSISAEQTVQNIDHITSMSAELKNVAQTITLTNSFRTGPEVIKGFHGIVNTATADYQTMIGGGSTRKVRSYTTEGQDDVCNAFISFVKVHQSLLHVIIGKHQILASTGTAYQMAAVLRGIEGVVDEIAFTLIGEVPHCATKATEEKKSLDNTLQKSIDKYANGIS